LTDISKSDVEIVIDIIFNSMLDAWTRKERVEIRGFGSFVTKIRKAREGRNPKTGKKVFVPKKCALFFTLGKELKDRVNANYNANSSS
jgi:integration host factor subunit beta